MNEPDDQAKFRRDVLWNVGSLGVAGVSGILLNVLIGVAYDAAALGVFNQVFAAYILASQLAALGVHHSVLQEVAASTDHRDRAGATTSALAVALLLGTTVALLFAAVAPLVGELVSSDDVGSGMRYVAPALLLFAIDKIALGAINGCRRMRWYAVLQGGRIALMLPAFAVCVALDVDRSTLPVIIVVAEGVTLVFALFCARDLLTRIKRTELVKRCRRHLRFGVKGFMAGVLTELNTRVDVLMLGYFSSDTVVGIYSFAAIIAEGMFQLLVVFRSNYAPLCAELLATGKRDELRALISRGRNRVYLAALPVGGIAVLGYTVILPLIVSAPIVTDSGSYFAVLIAGMVAVSGYIPFSQLLLQGRRPGWHTMLMLVTAVANIIANGALIQILGPIGAAVGTSIALVTMVASLRLLTRAQLGLRI